VNVTEKLRLFQQKIDKKKLNLKIFSNIFLIFY
jgi:hypothetical protein